MWHSCTSELALPRFFQLAELIANARRRRLSRRCSRARRSSPRGAGQREADGLFDPREFLGEGLASHYGGEFQGRPTASGEPFDKEQLTAAHRTLPFGACVLVVTVQGNRSVRVRVNDRRPFVAGRIIDVSEAAARELGFIEAGVVPVRLYRCR